jgi:Ser/Thr protein kinase RdoA (MazF antagonist)
MACASRIPMPKKMTTYSERADVGLIHADLMRENIFDGADGLALIDFDDCGWAYRLYDLMTELAQSLDDSDLADQTTHLIAGCAAQRPISTEGQALLPVFAFLRVLAGLGWVQPTYAPDDPKCALYLACRSLRSVVIFLRIGPNLV